MADANDAPETSGNETSTNSSRPRKRRVLRWVLGVVCVLVVLLALVVALLPTLLSTGPGNGFLVRTVNNNIPGRIEARSISLGWFGGQVIDGLTLRDPQQNVVAVVNRIEAPQAGLLPIALGGRKIGQVRVDIEEAHVVQTADGSTNVEHAFVQATPRDTAAPRAPQAPSAPQTPAKPRAASQEEPLRLGDLSIQVDLTAKRVTYEAPDLDAVELMDVKANANAENLRDIRINLDSNLRQRDQQGKITADATLTDAFDDEGTLLLDNAMVKADAQVANLPVGMVDRLAQQDGLLEALLGPQLTATVKADGGLASLNADVTAQSERLHVDTALVTADDALVGREGKITLELTPDAFAKLTAPTAPEGTADAPPAARLVQPVTLNLNLAGVRLPRTAEGLSLADASIDASATATDLVLDTAAQGRVEVRGLNVGVDAQRLADQVAATLSGTAVVAGQEGPIRAEVVARNLPLDASASRPPLEARVVATDLPVSVIDAVAQMGGKLSETLGERLNATVNATRDSAGGEMRLDAELRSPRLEGRIAGSYAEDGLFTLSTPEPMRLRVTPGAYRAWLTPAGGKSPRIVLDAAAPTTLAIRELRIGMLDPGPNDELRLDPRTALDVELTIPSGAFRDRETKEIIGLQDVRVVARSGDLRQDVDLDANMRVNMQSASAGTTPGTLTSQTQVRGLMMADGTIQTDDFDISSNTQVENVPSILIDTFAQQNGDLAAVLGPTTSSDIDVEYDAQDGGTMVFGLKSANVQGGIDAAISPDGVVTLNEDAELNVNVTRDVSRVLLARTNPLLAHAVSAKAPMKLVVKSEGFSMPARDFNWRQVTAQASLDPGTLELAPEGFTSALLQGLALVSSDIQVPNRNFAAQLTPVALNISRGNLTYRDLQMAFAGIDLGFGGLVDLAEGRFNLDMRLGGEKMPRELRGQTIPISGTFAEPFSRDTLVRALAAAAGGGLLQQGLGELLGGSRNRQDQAPREQQPRQGEQPTREQAPGAGEQRQPGLLEGILGGLEELDRRRQEEKAREEEAEREKRREERRRQRQEERRQQGQ